MARCRLAAAKTISQPHIVGLMSELLGTAGRRDRVEAGTGSGYQAAVLSLLARQVHTIERHADLARYAARILADLKLDNVRVHTGDGSVGLAEFAPYTAITVTAAAPHAPRVLLEQLCDGGRLVVPVGSRSGGQILERWRRNGARFDYENIIPVAFVPVKRVQNEFQAWAGVMLAAIGIGFWVIKLNITWGRIWKAVLVVGLLICLASLWMPDS
jgi:protein-L-isoaspartate(D-aspartate) O-methyltransferase